MEKIINYKKAMMCKWCYKTSRMEDGLIRKISLKIIGWLTPKAIKDEMGSSLEKARDIFINKTFEKMPNEVLIENTLNSGIAVVFDMVTFSIKVAPGICCFIDKCGEKEEMPRMIKMLLECEGLEKYEAVQSKCKSFDIVFVNVAR